MHSKSLRRGVGAAVFAACLSGCDEPDMARGEARVLRYAHQGVPWIFDDDGYQYLIDTGTPRSFVTPGVAGMDSDVFVTTVVDSWDLQGVGAGVEVVVTNDLPPAIVPMMGPDFGGIMGADLLSAERWLLDPVRSRFILDDDGDFTPWLTETAVPVRVPVAVTGGGVTCMQTDRCFEHDGLRMLVDVMVEGRPVTALLDTGATYTSMGVALLGQLDQEQPDGEQPRPLVTISRGWDQWRFARVDAMAVGDAEVRGVPVRIHPELDTALARLSVEAGRRVEMLLGHSFLLNFATGIDYPARVLTLARYDDPGPLETEMFVSYGIWLVGSPFAGGAPRVAGLVHGSEAEAAGLGIGDAVLTLDHRDATSMTTVELDIALRSGPQGQTIELEVVDSTFAEQRRPVARHITLTKRDLLPAG